MNLTNDLNDSQRIAVEYCDGPSLVIAGAGSGKTRVLTYKIAYLMEEKGIKPWNILALTFTNKAANEMKERITTLVGDNARFLNMGTFHSIFARILRAEAMSIGFNSNFTIYDESDSRSLIKNIIKDMTDGKGQPLDDKVYKPATIHSRISNAKNNKELPDDYKASKANMTSDLSAKIPLTGEIYEIYQQRLRTSNAMDFDDLLLYTFLLFRDHEDIRRKYGERFEYILVDEYQDTNAVQQQIVLQLVKDHERVCVVGDDAQSIYGFRGANIDNILEFQNKFADTKLFKLEQNYRSTQNIVEAANSLITHNQRQIPKNVYSHNDRGERLKLYNAYSDKEEASIVCKEIMRIKSIDNSNWEDFAILYRTNAQSRTFEEQMRKDFIPYRIVGGLSFYQRKEIKDIIAYMRLIVNRNDEEALRRIINYPKRGIGATTVDKVLQCAHALGIPAWQVMEQPVVCNLDVSKGTITKLQGFCTKIQQFINQSSIMDVYTLGTEMIRETGISKDLYSGSEPDDLARQENLQELINSMQDFVETHRELGDEEHVYIEDFLQEVSLMSDIDSDEESDSKVSLMTVHSAKGLEFKNVFVVGMEEEIFPSQMSCDSARKLEEERRLFYVAITRAEKRCILTCAQNRFRYGQLEFLNPSRFLGEISQEYINIQGKGFGGGASSYSRGYGMQNSNPVASQFQADPKPRITSHRSETAVDPYSDSFRRTFAASGGNLNRLNEAARGAYNRSTPNQRADRQRTFTSQTKPTTTTPNQRLRSISQYTTSARPSATSAPASIQPGDKIEHERFGIGTVIGLEGTGEMQKATVSFQHCGTKQLLLKFARFKKL